MKYYLDSEFHEDGSTIDLISIGIVAEDGREYYAVNADADWTRIWCCDTAEWVRKNVMPMIDRSIAIPKATIRQQVLDFVLFQPERDGLIPAWYPPEFWGYYSDYDWVVFCQLFGRMIDLPSQFPKFCRDVQQIKAHFAGYKTPEGYTVITPPQFETPEFAHHALEDARWIKGAHELLVQMIHQIDEERNPRHTLIRMLTGSSNGRPS